MWCEEEGGGRWCCLDPWNHGKSRKENRRNRRQRIIGRVGNMDCSKVRQLVGGGTKFGCGAKDGMDGSCSGGKIGIGKLGGVVCRR